MVYLLPKIVSLLSDQNDAVLVRVIFNKN